MNVELQIMFHILLLAICLLIGFIYNLNQDLINIGKKEVGRLPDWSPQLDHVFIFGLFFFIPLEIVFWILYWIFV